VFYQFDVEGDIIFELDSRASQYDARKGYAGGILAPLYQQAFKWLREGHNMLANVYSNASGFSYESHDTEGGTHRFDSDYDGPNDGGCWDTYEEAQVAGLKKLIEIVKEKQDGKNRNTRV
jgi:hypothetical protein